jgi:hypothetical protein
LRLKIYKKSPELEDEEYVKTLNFKKAYSLPFLALRPNTAVSEVRDMFFPKDKTRTCLKFGGRNKIIDALLATLELQT